MNELIELLKNEQHKRCCYGTREGDGRTCDCKFSILFNKDSLEPHGEYTGCPELRAAIWVLVGR